MANHKYLSNFQKILNSFISRIEAQIEAIEVLLCLTMGEHEYM